MEPIVVHATAKLLLSGEHSVLQGMPAVGMPLPLQLRLTLTPGAAQNGGGVLLSPSCRALLTGYPRFVAEFERMLRREERAGINRTHRTHRINRTHHIDIESDIPVGSGLGSSAALCVACAKALERLRATTDRSPEGAMARIWDDAHRLERHFHGRSSGVDTGLVTVGAPALFVHARRGIGTAISARYRWHTLHSLRVFMAVIVLPRRSTAKHMIASVGQASNRATMRSFCTETRRVAEHITSATLPDRYEPVYRGIHRLSLLQQQLGISTAESDEFIQQAVRYGAAAGKVSGAGGGGSSFVLFRDRALLSAALPRLIQFCTNRYPEYRLYSGEYARGEWRAFTPPSLHGILPSI